MVSLRCKMLVRDELNQLCIPFKTIELGVVDLEDVLSEEQRQQLKCNLLVSGLELMDDKKSMLIERIKNLIIELVHYSDELPKVKYSDYLAEKTKYDYAYLSNLFSQTEGITIAHFILLHKIERVKELIIYDELNLTEIAFMMNYSSAAALSNQFKKITGLTPSFFKNVSSLRRKSIENV